jgi:serine protease Do
MNKRMIFSLALTIGLLSGACLAAGSQPWEQQQGEETWGVNAVHGAYLGVRTQDINKDRLAALKLKDEAGVEVVMVDRDAPAAKAGIKEHDVLINFNGVRLESEEQLRRVVRETPPGRKVAIGLLRDGQPVNINVTLADRKDIVKIMAKKNGWPAMPAMPAFPNMPMASGFAEFEVPQVSVIMQTTGRSGITVEGLTPQLAEYFGVKNGAVGVLIRAVEKGSAGEASGFRAGDVILKVDKEKISDPGDWRHALHGKTGTVALSILRDKKEQVLNLSLPEHKRGSLIPEADIENAMKDAQVEIERIRPLLQEHQEELKMIAQKMTGPDGEIRKELDRAREEVRKALEEHKLEIIVTY